MFNEVESHEKLCRENIENVKKTYNIVDKYRRFELMGIKLMGKQTGHKRKSLEDS
jgi:hypothetical protein